MTSKNKFRNTRGLYSISIYDVFSLHVTMGYGAPGVQVLFWSVPGSRKSGTVRRLLSRLDLFNLLENSFPAKDPCGKPGCGKPSFAAKRPLRQNIPAAKQPLRQNDSRQTGRGKTSHGKPAAAKGPAPGPRR